MPKHPLSKVVAFTEKCLITCDVKQMEVVEAVKGADGVGCVQGIDEERTTSDATTKRTSKRDIEIYNLE